MWLRRLVGLVMIIVCIGMNALVVVGFFAPDKTKSAAIAAQQAASAPFVLAPQVTLTANPISTTAGNFSALTWTSTNDPTSCTASGSWVGLKTPVGAESTGRISIPGNYKYTITCTNSGGAGTVSVTVAVGPANAPPPITHGSSSGSATSAAVATYCGGRAPCLGPSEVAQHGSSGNCWGWLGDRVINVSAFDSGFHAARSGVSTIQLASICGKDLTSAVNGGVSTPEYPNGHAHKLGATSNTD